MFEGGCTCGAIRYRLSKKPMYVHCCHCTWCQRETGAAFALNGMIETEFVKVLSGKPEVVDTPSASGRGQQIVRCPACRVAVWSHYSAAGEILCFIRVGTLDHPEQAPPDIHIFTSSKQPWLQLPNDAPVVAEYYRRSEYWPPESLARHKALLSGK